MTTPYIFLSTNLVAASNALRTETETEVDAASA
jgi:hypothetical protein